jgi:hypothetical protein
VWVDYVTYLTTGLVLLAGIGLVLVMIRDRARAWAMIALAAVILVGVVATVFVRPERFREPGEDLQIVEVEGSHQTEEVAATISSCLSLFRRVGPLSFIVGNDLLPGENWDRGPFNGCEEVGHLNAKINLPDTVRSGEWMLCDTSTCFPLAREA